MSPEVRPDTEMDKSGTADHADLLAKTNRREVVIIWYGRPGLGQKTNCQVFPCEAVLELAPNDLTSDFA